MEEFKIPLQLREIMAGYNKLWAVTGGWAIDLFLNRVTREHEDIEIAIYRKEQLILQRYLHLWKLEKCMPGADEKLSEWKAAEYLELPVHEIHATKEDENIGKFEILLNENDKSNWLYRRNPEINLKKHDVIRMSTAGIPILNPVIVLLYKSKNPEEKDNHDFENSCLRLNPKDKQWLRASIKFLYPSHPWLKKL
jgi:hypothetical protein